MVQRTSQQNKALWAYFTMLANELNEAGLDQRTVLKPSVSIPWNKDAIHDQLWIPIQNAVLNTDSTTELNKQEVSEIYDILNRHLSERFGIGVEFPSHPEGYWDSAPQIDDVWTKKQKI